MRVLIFILWLTLGAVYGLIWMQGKSCCDHIVTASDSNAGNGISNTSSSTPSIESDKAILPVLPPPKEPTGSGSSNEDTASIAMSLSLNEDAGCVFFKWGKSDPVLKPCFESLSDSIVHTMKKGQTLELINEYFEQENQVMASGDLGLVRSARLKELFIAKGIAAEDIKLRSIARSDSSGKAYRLMNTFHARHVFMNDQVKELDNKTLIYFKYASNQQASDVLVNQYLSDLVSRLKNTDEKIRLVGHTDDDASDDHNMKLGLQRALLIKNLLVARGIKGSRIKVSSKGEEEPISPNDTEENRKLNRRVELTLIPQGK